MKQSFMRPFLCVAGLLLTMASTLQAQQRACDFSIDLVSPAANAVIPSMSEFDVIVNLTNNGSDTLVAGDTIYYHSPLMFVFDYYPVVLTHGVAPGDMVVLTLEEITNSNENVADEVLDFCVEVRHNLNDEGVFTDDDLSDNTSCNEITLEPSGTMGITDTKLAASLELYPNPAQDYLYLTLSTDQQVKAHIFDMNGRQLQSRELGRVSLQQPASLDVGELPPGTYLLELMAGTQRVTALFSRQ